MYVKRIETKVNLKLCLVFDNIFRLYNELPTRFVIEPKKQQIRSPKQSEDN